MTVAGRPVSAAIIGSLAAHGLLIGLALYWLPGPPVATPDDLEAIAVSLVTIETASSDVQAATRSDATATTVAAGVQSAAADSDKPVSVEAIEPRVEPRLPIVSEPVQVADIVPAVKPTPSVDVADVAPLPVLQVSPVVTDALPATPQAAEPPPRVKPPTLQPPKPTRPRAAPASSGSGGRDQADARAAASAPSGAGHVDAGGSAAVSRYPGLVQAKLKRALRYPAGADRARAEVHVRFTVLAGGGVTGISVVTSSGSAILDQAAEDTVSRAAPFPPIPAGDGRPSWTFTMPLTFRR